MSRKDWVSLGVAAVTFLLGAFGGFLRGSAPPEHPLHTSNTTFAVGVASFITLFVFLLIAATVRVRSQKAGRHFWFAVAAGALAIFVTVSLKYRVTLDRYEFVYPEGSDARYTAGETLTPKADSVAKALPALSKTDLLAGFGGLPAAGAVWEERSLDAAHRQLTWQYVLLVVSVGVALFALTEGILSRGVDDAGSRER